MPRNIWFFQVFFPFLLEILLFHRNQGVRTIYSMIIILKSIGIIPFPLEKKKNNILCRFFKKFSDMVVFQIESITNWIIKAIQYFHWFQSRNFGKTRFSKKLIFLVENSFIIWTKKNLKNRYKIEGLFLYSFLWINSHPKVFGQKIIEIHGPSKPYMPVKG